MTTYVRTSTGLIRPRMYRGFPREGVLRSPRAPAELSGLRVRRRGTGPLLFVGNPPAKLTRERADQTYAREYEAACKTLSKGRAGRRAAELLFSHLSRDQVNTARRQGYFDQTIYDRATADLMHRLGMPVGFHTVRVRFLRGFPNGNVILNAPRADQVNYQVCLHPAEPYPIDDICLAQWMLLMSDPDEFIKAGNVSRVGQETPEPVDRMFNGWRTKTPEDLVLSQVRHAPAPTNVTLGAE